MTDTTKNNVPDGFILLQTQNGAPKYAACMTGRLAGWLMKKYPDGNWVSERKLTNLEVMQAEDQRDDGIVHETPAATIQEPVMVAEPMTLAGFFAEAKHLGCKIPADMAEQLAAPMVADPAGVADAYMVRDSHHVVGIYEKRADAQVMLSWSSSYQLVRLFAATVKAVPSEALDAARYRWLVEYANCPEGTKVQPVQDWVRGWIVNKVDLDAAIDGALAAPLADKTGGGE